ncbi:MAG: CoA transferase [Dehalococcoidia bacterium]|nr:CoA transferase [Dehalococcoidia bacterium]
MADAKTWQPGMSPRGPLEGIRVIDIATPRAELAGRVLADLGADVVKVEPPGGAAARTMAPFEHGREGDPEASLYWATVAMGKRSVVLDIAEEAGRATLRELLAGADIFVESFDPGYLAGLGLGYEDVAALNPTLVYVSVTPFGQDGPRAHAPATDLTLEAAGGLLSLQGDGDRPPVPVGYPQASFHAGAQAAADAIVALHERSSSGLGQYLDVSMQAAMVWTLMNATGYPKNTGGNPPGYCEQRNLPAPQLFPGLQLPRLWQCQDGLINFTISLPGIGPRTLDTVARWAEREGAMPAALAGRNWADWILEVTEGRLDVADLKACLEAIAAFFLTRKKTEAQAFSAEHGILLGAIYNIADLLVDPHLAARDYWTEVGGRTHPGPFARLSKTPLVMDRPAPALGDAGDAAALVRPAPQLHGSGDRRPCFDGLKIADFAWVGVGPIISKHFADHGATVVHIESMTRPDVLRLLPPFKDTLPGVNRSQFMANFNSSKLGMALDLSQEKGQELARRLVAWADVAVESFTPGTMAKWDLDYAHLRDVNPSLVMLSTCLRGQTGPERTYGGFGGQGAALAGLHHITGWPDRHTTGPWGAYTDFINPRFGVAALTSALLHRQKTGEGQHIDLSQTEAGIHFVEPLVLDYTVNGRAAPPSGHNSLYACPHGAFACEGLERYVAIACETPAQWHALRAAAGLQGFDDARFDALGARIEAKQAIEDQLRAWCAPRDAFEAADQLLAAGVPAYAVMRPTDLYDDAQLAHRDFFVTLEHGEMGPTPYDGLVTRFSATPGRLRNAAPLLGQDTDRVLSEVLGLTEDEVVDYAVAGVLT